MNNGLTNIAAVTTNGELTDLYCIDCANELFAGVENVTIEQQFTWSNNEADSPSHCPECGVLLEQTMTVDGDDCIRDAVIEALSTGQAIGLDEESPVWEWVEAYGDNMTEDTVLSPAQCEEILGIDAVTEAYLAAQLWTGILDFYTNTLEFGGESLTADSVLDSVVTVEELPEEIKTEAREDVEQFLSMVSPYLKFWPNAAELTAEQLGHDFSLTRNHHGAGFWDRGLEELGAWLTRVAQSMGSSVIYGAVVIADLENPSLEKDNLRLDTLRIWSMG